MRSELSERVNNYFISHVFSIFYYFNKTAFCFSLWSKRNQLSLEFIHCQQHEEIVHP